ncbi:MAG: L-rhamnose mutarotase [Bacteroidetes bacterium]|nr:L-rhamnose mutarotase [Bacteroidota bacterium]MDA1119464.1 L-rhamnose mutarotase [Bacteroidota bacterium]
MKTYYLALDLKNDPKLIVEYEEYHRKVWPEILQSIASSGIQSMEIFRVENRVFMIMNVNDEFSFDRKNEMDNNNKRVQEWEDLMWKYQQALPNSKPGEKWRLMDKIFHFDDSQISF